MQTASNAILARESTGAATGAAASPMGGGFQKLEHVNRPTVETASAAFYLNRKQQTLRGWACLENGPLRPVRLNGRLAWSVSEIRRLLGVA